jgi:hypothetical protein
MSDWLRAKTPPIRPGDFVLPEIIYPRCATQEMRNVQLYFTKLTGCHLVGAGVKFDHAALATSILTGTQNPYVHLKFGISRTGLPVSMSDLWVAPLDSDDSAAFAVWVYSVEAFVVHVMYAIEGERRNGLIGAWHPRSGSNPFVLADFP